MLVKIRRRGMYRKTRRWECQRGSGIDGFPTKRVQPTTATWFTKAAIVLSGLVVAGTAWAQCGITQSCISPPPGILPPITSLCEVNMCFSSRENRERYERENNCIFPDNSLCRGRRWTAKRSVASRMPEPKKARSGKSNIQNSINPLTGIRTNRNASICSKARLRPTPYGDSALWASHMQTMMTMP